MPAGRPKGTTGFLAISLADLNKIFQPHTKIPVRTSFAKEFADLASENQIDGAVTKVNNKAKEEKEPAKKLEFKVLS